MVVGSRVEAMKAGTGSKLMKRIWMFILLLVGECWFAPGLACAQWEGALWIANETSYWSVRQYSLWNPGGKLFTPPAFSNDLVSHGMLSWKYRERVHLQGAFNDRVYYAGDSSHHLYLTEAFANVSLSGHWDLLAGKKINRWGTGYAFNPSGFLDPPKNPADPQDRLELRSGTEMAELDWTGSNQAFNFVYAAPRLYFTHQPVLSHDRAAFRYNRLWKGLDFSVMAMIPSQAPARWGANFSYVLGNSLELHGEAAVINGFAAIDPTVKTQKVWQSVVGFNYTLKNGWNAIGEWSHNGEGLSLGGSRDLFQEAARLSSILSSQPNGPISQNPVLFPYLQLQKRYAEVIPGRDMLFLIAGHYWKQGRLGFQTILLGNLADHSFSLIPQVNYQFKKHWGVYLRGNYFSGKLQSQFGSLVYQGVLNMGVKFNL
jgi:hypothetical protein